MASTFPLRIIAPAAEVFHGQAALVEIPGAEGDFGVLPNHSAFFSMIRPGIITVEADIGSKRFFVASGYADVSPDQVTILCEQALDLASVSKQQVAERLEAAEAALATATTDAAKRKAEANLLAAKALGAALQ